MDVFPTDLEVLLRLVLAAVIGGALGFERQWHRKPAGLRTHMMVSLGAATFTLLGFEIYTSVVHDAAGATRVDPTRVLQGLVGGLGFLGAGTIVHHRGSVEGLTTASSIWITGAIGVACGGGHYAVATISSALALLILAAVGYLEHRMRGQLRSVSHSDATAGPSADPPD